MKTEKQINMNRIQPDMPYDKPRCPKCTVEYKGHRSGSYRPSLKAVYERDHDNGQRWNKIGFRCPHCNNIFKLNEIMIDGGKKE